MSKIPLPALDNLATEVWRQGADALWVHARKAWLEGLSPKENRDIPPLNYSRVHDLKTQNASHFIGINGGIEDLIQARSQLEFCDGVMLGRAAYHNCSILRGVDQAIYGDKREMISYESILSAMCDYAEQHLSKGGRLNQITRHMMGLFQGRPGARIYRQKLSTEAVKTGAGLEVLVDAFKAICDKGMAA